MKASLTPNVGVASQRAIPCWALLPIALLALATAGGCHRRVVSPPLPPAPLVAATYLPAPPGHPSWSSDGWLAVALADQAGGQAFRTVLFDGNDGQARLLSPTDDDRHPDWHPDRHELVIERSFTDRSRLVLVEPRTGVESVLADGPFVHGAPEWCGKGCHISCVRVEPGDPLPSAEAWILAVEARVQGPLLPSHTGIPVGPESAGPPGGLVAWSPDGSMLLNTYPAALLSFGDVSPTPWTEGSVSVAKWSPDGEQVAVMASPDRLLVGPPDSPRRVVRSSGCDVPLPPAWAPDSRLLACVVNVAGRVQGAEQRLFVAVYDLDAARFTEVLELDGLPGVFTWIPNTRTLICAVPSGTASGNGNTWMLDFMTDPPRISDAGPSDLSGGYEWAWDPTGNQLAVVDAQSQGVSLVAVPRNGAGIETKLKISVHFQRLVLERP